MPGISFLFKKTFHPARLDNQKKVYLSEQDKLDIKNKEDKLAQEVKKEREIQEYEALGSIEQRDPRSAALKFMYSMPIVENDKKKSAVVGKHYEPKIDADGDDEMVKKFKARLAGESSSSSNSAVGTSQSVESIDDADNSNRSHIAPEWGGFGKGAVLLPQSALEKNVGKKTQIGLTNDELVERHPFLKNAPVDGSYAKNMSAHHKPFSQLIRNVQCMRCGKWGHRSGERECALRDFNPRSQAEKDKLDPMAEYVRKEQQSQYGSSSSSHYGQRRQYYGEEEEEEDGESDPEAMFLATLTKREKMLLLRRLKVSCCQYYSCE